MIIWGEAILSLIFMFEVLKKDINIFDSLECGQIFRFKKLDEKTYEVFSNVEHAVIKDNGDHYVLDTTNDEYFKKFLNLDVDYMSILKELKKNKHLQCIGEDVKLRILKQDPFEMIISFIVSANNNIPRIKGIIEKMCLNDGEKIGDYYAFPTAEKLAKRDVKFFESIGLGYRAPYILKTANAIASKEFEVDEL